MSSLKRWVQHGSSGGGNFTKWETEGQEVTGLWRGQREGKYGPIGDVDTTEGRVSFPIHTALVYLVEGLMDGQEIKIVYGGKILNPKSGREFKQFELFVAVTDDDDDAKLPF